MSDTRAKEIIKRLAELEPPPFRPPLPALDWIELPTISTTPPTFYILGPSVNMSSTTTLVADSVADSIVDLEKFVHEQAAEIDKLERELETIDD